MFSHKTAIMLARMNYTEYQQTYGYRAAEELLDTFRSVGYPEDKARDAIRRVQLERIAR